MMTHFIFGNLSPARPSSSLSADPARHASTVTLVPPAPNARITPLRTHPRNAAESFTKRPAHFIKYTKMREDEVLAARNPNSNNNAGGWQIAAALNERPGLEWGSWLEMPRELGGIRPSMIPFLADSFKNLPQILPKEERDGLEARCVVFVFLAIVALSPA